MLTFSPGSLCLRWSIRFRSGVRTSKLSRQLNRRLLTSLVEVAVGEADVLPAAVVMESEVKILGYCTLE